MANFLMDGKHGVWLLRSPPYKGGARIINNCGMVPDTEAINVLKGRARIGPKTCVPQRLIIS